MQLYNLKFQTQTYRRHAKALMANTKPKEYPIDK